MRDDYLLLRIRTGVNTSDQDVLKVTADCSPLEALGAVIALLPALWDLARIVRDNEASDPDSFYLECAAREDQA